MTLDVRLLGPLEVRVDGRAATIPRGNATTVLALLLDDAGKVVPVSGLVAGVYAEDLPLDPEAQIQNTVGVLRGRLGTARDRIETVGRAYRFRIDETELDTLRCKAKESQARELRREGRSERAAEVLREALGEWRGPALADLPGRVAGAIGRRLDEYRLTLLEQRIDADIDTGRAPGAVQELRQILAAHDTRQRLVALLMRALHACGRTAEALAAFADLKERLADALGADPDRELVELHTAILRDQVADPAPAALPDPPPAAPAPAMLPRATPRFTGREREIRALDRFLADAGAEAGLAAVTGMGGVGKTALAVRWAHRVAHRFPDGQLYFDLRGFDPAAPPADPEAVLGEALAALGAQPPPGLGERVGLYRTLLAQRRVLIVLDNARDAPHVRPLLATAPGSFTIVTSRDRLVGLDMHEGAETVPIGPLPAAESEALLARRIGPERAAADRAAVARIAAACGGLPLALTLVGAWAAEPDLALGALADRFAAAPDVLGVLVASDAAADLRTVFDSSYQLLGERDALAFCLFGLHPGPELTPAAAASLMGAAPGEARAALAELAESNLVERLPGERYAMHGLLRDYAAECFADEVLDAERRAAALRMVEHYLHAAHRADRFAAGGHRVDPGQAAPGVHVEPVADAAGAAAWFAAERRVLSGLLRTEAGFQADLRVWQLGWILAERLLDRDSGRELLEVQRAALAAAERRGGAFERAVSLGYLGFAHRELGEPDRARECAERSAVLAERDGGTWVRGFGAYARARAGAAAEHARLAKDLFRTAGDRLWERRAAALAATEA